MIKNLFLLSITVALFSCSNKEVPQITPEPEEPISPEMALQKEQISKYALSDDATNILPFPLDKFDHDVIDRLDENLKKYTIVTAWVDKGLYLGFYDSSNNSKSAGFTIDVDKSNMTETDLKPYHLTSINDTIFASFVIGGVRAGYSDFTTTVLFDTKNKSIIPLTSEVSSSGSAILYTVTPWYNGNLAILADEFSASKLTVEKQNNRIFDQNFQTILSGFTLPDTNVFNRRNLISNTETIALSSITGSAIYFDQSYLFPLQRKDVPWGEEVTSESWYINYLDHPKEILFEKIESKELSYISEGSNLKIEIHLKGWIKPAFVNNKPNEEYFEQEIHKMIYVDLDTKKITKTTQL
ncbi:hypothetical protein [Parapedobacter indicus]|uniref:Uncharacterized protein n=1 Tax=Parapedobacter indicus TaxID=1477437 RepID=A0A1I3DZI4_9SPHI|nr:hypothetical protein [Parapedobacter indicus]PPL04907.1 hypothetical protein CLV26_101717 [Parapedobacter indicus]SFH92142.1 hypothetical protein SAMN05444682_101703 [Parapedobacter indicus]